VAETNPIKFLLNQGSEAQSSEIVRPPAFSLTKVLSAGAVIVAPIATIVVDKLDEGLTAQHYVALAIGILAFLAVAASADVLARAIATSAEKKAIAAAAGMGQLLTFRRPISGHRIVDNDEDVAVQILAAAQADQSYFLVKEGDSISWLPASHVTT
jgi:hypothetical protein